MEEKIALVSCLTLLYLENKLGESGTHTALLKKVTDGIRTPDFVSDGDGHAAIAGVKSLVVDLSTGDVEFDQNAVLQKIRIYCSLDRTFYDTAKGIFDDVYADENSIKKAMSANISSLHHYINSAEIRKVISSASYSLNKDPNANLRDIATKLSDDLSHVTRNSIDGKSSTLVKVVGTDTPSGMAEVFESTKKQLAGSVLKTGWKDLNKMMGVNGGVVPGELWLMPGLPHEGKTIFSMMMFLSFGLFNKPDDFVPKGKKALLLDLSFENELEQNMPQAYKAIHDHFEGTAANIKDIDPETASEYVCSKLAEHGWVYKFERHINSEFTVAMLRERFAYYEGQGYHIVALRGDYFGTINKVGLGNGTHGSEIREMYRLIRNITGPRKCAVLAPHQLSPKAKELKAIDPSRYVRLLPGKGYYDGCTTVDNEADGELYFGKAELQGKSFLEVARGKHRTLIDTPVSHRYTVVPFNDIGILPWDVDRDYNNCLKTVSVVDTTAVGDMFNF